jgi:hypothetical protein
LTQTSYVWWDGAVQDAVFHDADLTNSSTIASVTASGNFGASTKVYKTSYTINGIGQTTSSAVQDGIPKTLAYTLDANGQIVRRTESRNSNPTGPAPREVFYRYGGKQMGMVGNNGTNDTGYVQSVQDRTKAARKAGSEIWAYCLMPNHVPAVFDTAITLPRSSV